jgi:hypothetical protein
MSLLEPSAYDCPHCGKSNWMGADHPDGCQCPIPEQILTAPFTGKVEVTMPTAGGGHSDVHLGYGALVRARITKRVELFHFIQGLEFHLHAAQQHLAFEDKRLAEGSRGR